MTKTLALAALATLVALPVGAQVPNREDTVKAVFRAYPWDLKEKSENGCFTEEVAFRLHQADPGNWGHLRKFGGQNQWNEHAVDGVLHKSGYFIDIIGSSESANAKPGWEVEKVNGSPFARYTDTAKYFITPTAGCRPDAPPPVDPPAPPATVDLTPVLDRLNEILLRVNEGVGKFDIYTLRDVVNTLADLLDRERETQEQIRAVEQQLKDVRFPCFTATMLGRPVRLCPEK